MRTFLSLMFLSLIACTDESGSYRALRGQGFTDIQLGGAQPFSCGQEDHFSNEFRAKNARGEWVHGAVCCGVFKGCTVRF